MSDLVNELTSRTGISPELVQKGLGAILSFLKKELGEDTFDKISTSIPQASALTSHYESAPEPPEGAAPQGGLFELVSGLAGKLLGGKAGKGPICCHRCRRWGSSPNRSNPSAQGTRVIKSHLSPELIQKLMAALPLLAKFLTAGAKQKPKRP